MIRNLLTLAPRAILSSFVSPPALVIKAREAGPRCITHVRAASTFQACSTTTTTLLPRPYSVEAGSEEGDNDTIILPSDSYEDPSPPRRKTKTEREKMLESLPVTYADISRANVAIRNGVKRTSCVKSYFLSELLGANIFLKTEFQQFTGSFKERGARNAILTLLREMGKEKLQQTGVIAASAGNHALALAYHGKDLGVPVTVVMPTVAPLAKVDKCRVSLYYC